MFLLILLIHVFYADNCVCFAEPSTQDTVSVKFDALLSPQFIEHWNKLSLLESDDLADSLSHLGLEELSSEGGVFFQEHLNSTEFLCLGAVSNSADSMYAVEAQWLVDDSGSMNSMVLCITPIVDEQFSNVDLKSSKASVRLQASSVRPIERSGTYSGGSGTANDPYQIATSEDLIELSLSSSDWSSHFIQTANIIFSADYVSEDWDGNGVINTSDEVGMQPIGTSSVPFSGVYDGSGYRVKYLLVDNGNDDAGMFGFCDGASLLNIGLAKAYVYGWSYVGALVGYCNTNNTIYNCYVTGIVSGFRYVGGLIGYIKRTTTVDQCISTCSVDGFLYVAGFIGCTNSSNVVISNSVSAGSADGFIFTGGLIGSSGKATVEDVYSSTAVDGVIVTGGLIGNAGNGDVSDAYWDVESSGVSTSAGADVEGLTAEEMTDSSTFENWDTDVWTFDPDLNGGLPVIVEQTSFYEPVETEFTGSGSWDDPDNWTNGVPDAEEVTTAIISGECDLDDPVVVENLIIENGGVLNVEDEGDIVVDDELIIVSGSSGSGEYYTSPGASADTVEQEKFFIGGEWTFMSTPMTITADEIFPDLKLASRWDDPEGEYWVVEYSEDKRARMGTGMQDVFDGAHEIKAGRGYMVWVDNDQVSVFEHIVPNNSSLIDTEFSSNYALNNAGWNLVGNPFTYTMTYDDVFDCEYNKANFSGAVYLWDGVSYNTWVDGVGDAEASVISPLEAFFVKRKGGADGHFCMAKGDCDCTSIEVKSSSVVSSEEMSEEVLSVLLTANGKEDKTYLRVMSQTAEGKSAQKFELSNGVKPIVYSFDDNGGECAINAVVVSDNENISLGYSLPNDVDNLEFSFLVEEESQYNYMLFDNNTGIVYEIENDKIIAISESADDHNRFSIHVETKVPPVVTSEHVLGNSLDDFFNLLSLSGGISILSKDSNLDVELYNMDGNVVTVFSLLKNGQRFVNLETGVYIVCAKSGNNKSVKKVVVY